MIYYVHAPRCILPRHQSKSLETEFTLLSRRYTMYNTHMIRLSSLSRFTIYTDIGAAESPLYPMSRGYQHYLEGIPTSPICEHPPYHIILILHAGTHLGHNLTYAILECVMQYLNITVYTRILFSLTLLLLLSILPRCSTYFFMVISP